MYYTRIPITIYCDPLNLGKDLLLEVSFRVSKPLAATLTEPAEPACAEVHHVRLMAEGAPKTETLLLPGWFEAIFADTEELSSYLLAEAAELKAAAADDAAEAKREELSQENWRKGLSDG